MNILCGRQADRLRSRVERDTIMQKLAGLQDADLFWFLNDDTQIHLREMFASTQLDAVLQAELVETIMEGDVKKLADLREKTSAAWLSYLHLRLRDFWHEIEANARVTFSA